MSHDIKTAGWAQNRDKYGAPVALGEPTRHAATRIRPLTPASTRPAGTHDMNHRRAVLCRSSR